jgi:hypothetical protein
MDISQPKAFVRQATTACACRLDADHDQPHVRMRRRIASRETQNSLYTLARSYSPWITPDRRGASANGWRLASITLALASSSRCRSASMDEH